MDRLTVIYPGKASCPLAENIQVEPLESALKRLHYRTQYE